MARLRSTWNPFDLLRDLGPRLEAGFERLAMRGVGSDAFSRAMHKALGASLAARRAARSVQDGILEALNLPTRTDIQALADKLQVVEDRLISLAADLSRVEGARPPLHALPRTRKPPAVAGPGPAAAPASAPRRRKPRA